jgi:hypothetical protein
MGIRLYYSPYVLSVDAGMSVTILLETWNGWKLLACDLHIYNESSSPIQKKLLDQTIFKDYKHIPYLCWDIHQNLWRSISAYIYTSKIYVGKTCQQQLSSIGFLLPVQVLPQGWVAWVRSIRIDHHLYIERMLFAKLPQMELRLIKKICIIHNIVHVSRISPASKFK